MLHSASIRRVAILTALLLVGLISTTFPQHEEATGRPRILVTNDDGIHAPGLRALVKELAEFADVTVSAPPDNRSGASHSLTYFTIPKLVQEVEVEGAQVAMAVDGTPADAAHFGIVHLGKDKPFDMLVSGMNHGSNVGDLSHGSGTVGAAMEGAFRGIPSIAVSMDSRMRDLEAAAGFARRFAEQWFERGVDPGVVYSINIPTPPAEGWKGVRAAPMGGAYLSTPSYRETEKTEEGTVFRPVLTPVQEFPEGSDSQSFADGYVTITPLKFNWTHREALEDLAKWRFE